jgi:VRR-NUC domain
MRRHQRPEQQIQKAVIAHLKTRATTGVVYFAVPNGGFRKPVEAAIMKSQGVVAGVPDLLLFHDNKAYALELKAEGGRPTEAQLEMLNRLSAAGVYTAICYGPDQPIAQLESWNLLRGKASLQGETWTTPWPNPLDLDSEEAEAS